MARVILHCSHDGKMCIKEGLWKRKPATENQPTKCLIPKPTKGWECVQATPTFYISARTKGNSAEKCLHVIMQGHWGPAARGDHTYLIIFSSDAVCRWPAYWVSHMVSSIFSVSGVLLEFSSLLNHYWPFFVSNSDTLKKKFAASQTLRVEWRPVYTVYPVQTVKARHHNEIEDADCHEEE